MTNEEVQIIATKIVGNVMNEFIKNMQEFDEKPEDFNELLPKICCGLCATISNAYLESFRNKETCAVLDIVEFEEELDYFLYQVKDTILSYRMRI